MSKQKKFRLTPIRIFFGTVLLVVSGATVYDVANRETTTVIDTSASGVTSLDEMDLNDLRIRFDSIQLANTVLRPSIMIALEDRIEVARMMVNKSRSPEEKTASQIHLIRALFQAYAVRRENNLEFAELLDEMDLTIDQVVSGGNGKERIEPLLIRFQTATHQILDGTQTPETLERTQKVCDIIGIDFFDVETATELEKFLIPLVVKPELGPDVVEVVEQVRRVFSTHPDKQLRDWTTKLADDVVFRDLNLFEIHQGVIATKPGTPEAFLSILDELFQRNVSPLGYGRLVGFCRDFDARDEYEVTLEAYRRIEKHISGPELIGENRNNIVACQNGVRRIESLGKVVVGEFTDVNGRSVDLDGERLKNCPVLVLAVRSGAEFGPAFAQTINMNRLSTGNIRFVVICIGMNAEKVRTEFSKWLKEDFFLVPDPESNSLLYSACPTDFTPTIWALSRDHKLMDFQILPDQLSGLIDALTFIR